MQGTQVRSLGQDYPLEEEMATHPSIPAWKIPWTEEPGRLQSMEPASAKGFFTTSATWEAQLTSIEFNKYLSSYYTQGTVIFSLRLSLPPAFLTSLLLTEEKMMLFLFYLCSQFYFFLDLQGTCFVKLFLLLFTVIHLFFCCFLLC